MVINISFTLCSFSLLQIDWQACFNNESRKTPFFMGVVEAEIGKLIIKISNSNPDNLIKNAKKDLFLNIQVPFESSD